jgi:hypothetical protein
MEKYGRRLLAEKCAWKNMAEGCWLGTVTFFIQTFFIRDKVYTNFLYTGQILYGTKFIQDKGYTGANFIRGQSLYGDKVYTGQSSYSNKVYTGTKFIQTFFTLYSVYLNEMKD